MPPDISSSSRRLEKVIEQLENEALNSNEKSCYEDVTQLSTNDHSSNSTPLFQKSIDTYIKTRKGFLYVPSETFSLIWSRIIFFGSFQVLYFWALYHVLFSQSTTVTKTWIFGECPSERHNSNCLLIRTLFINLPCLFLFSLVFVCHQCTRCHSWCPSTLVPQIIPSKMATQVIFDDWPLSCRPKYHFQLVSRPSSSSQVFRHGC